MLNYCHFRGRGFQSWPPRCRVQPWANF